MMTQRLHCIVLLEWNKRCGPIEDQLDRMAPMLSRFLGLPSQDPYAEVRELVKVTRRMMDEGSRYRNLERSLEAGFTLCIGKNVKRTS